MLAAFFKKADSLKAAPSVQDRATVTDAIKEHSCKSGYFEVNSLTTSLWIDKLPEACQEF